MNTYQVTCREWSYFIKEVEANSEDEARKKIHNNVNGFKTIDIGMKFFSSFIFRVSFYFFDKVSILSTSNSISVHS